MAPTRHPPISKRAHRLHPHLDHELERPAATVRLAQDGRRDPRQPRRILHTNLGLRTLEDVGWSKTSAKDEDGPLRGVGEARAAGVNSANERVGHPLEYQ